MFLKHFNLVMIFQKVWIGIYSHQYIPELKQTVLGILYFLFDTSFGFNVVCFDIVL